MTVKEGDEAVRRNPKDAEAYFNRGCEYYDKGDYDRAIADYTEALRLNPNYAYAYNNRGNA
jgi:tetratricopeptide (TPR) repeat protein